MDFVARRIGNAYLAPEGELTLRVFNGFILGLGPLDQLRLGAARKRGLHDVVFHKCAGSGLNLAILATGKRGIFLCWFTATSTGTGGRAGVLGWLADWTGALHFGDSVPRKSECAVFLLLQ